MTLVGGVTLLAFLLRLHTALAPLETQDERNWMLRTLRFSDALHHGDFRDMSAVPDHTTDLPQTMPGVTTMWIGTIGRWVWSAGHHLGLWSGSDGPQYGGGETYASTSTGLQVAQVTMTVVTALLIGLVVYLVVRWGGRLPAAVAGILLATEPFLVAHGAVLHTDELMTLSGVGGLIATALALGIPSRTSWADRRSVLLLAGALSGAALLTKIAAVVFVGPLGLLVLWARVVAFRASPASDGFWRRLFAGCGAMARSMGWWAGAYVTTVVVAYPALWFRAGEEWDHVWLSTNLAGEGHIQYFLGEPTETPGPAYYLIAMPFRVTPWLLLAGVAAAAILWWRRSCRGFAGALLCMGAPVFVTLSLASKQFDRYALPLIALAAVGVGLAAQVVIDAISARRPADPEAGDGQVDERGGTPWPQRLGVAGAMAAAAMTVHSAVLSPHGLAYFNPLLGGASTGQHALLVGWGESNEETGRIIARHAGSCDGLTVAGYPFWGSFYRCGETSPSGEDPDYVILAKSVFQRSPDWANLRRANRELIGVVRILGINYYEIYGPLPTTQAAAT